MGDRANLAVIQDQKRDEQVWLYTHSDGYNLPTNLQIGLTAGRGRWDDCSYLTKILFGHIVPADDWQGECGYGISTSISDNEYEILVVDCHNQQVFTMPAEKLEDGRVPRDYQPASYRCWSFEDYCALNPQELPWGESVTA